MRAFQPVVVSIPVALEYILTGDSIIHEKWVVARCECQY
jgi:hypothetical protein